MFAPFAFPVVNDLFYSSHASYIISHNIWCQVTYLLDGLYHP